MAIFYVCSMDQYGAGLGPNFTVDEAESGWALDNDIMIGDAWTNLPTFEGETSGSASVKVRALGDLNIAAPSWGARQGDYALIADQMGIKFEAGHSSGSAARPDTAVCAMAIPGATAAVRTFHFAFGMDSLPTLAGGHGYICDFQASSGAPIARLGVDPSGRLLIYDGASLTSTYTGLVNIPGTLATTASTVISANTWYSINVRLTSNGAGSMDFEIWVGDISAGNKVMDASALAVSNPGGLTNVDILGWLPASACPSSGVVLDSNERALRDIVLYDSSGTYNNTPIGQVFCSAQEMRTEDTEGTNWGVQHRDKYLDGVGNYTTNKTGIRCADAADIEIAAQDFTFETEIRFSSLPTATNITEIFTKWSTAADLAYRLYYDSDTSSLIWEISTDGAANTIIKTAPFTPLLDRWYHIAVSRWTDTTQFTNIFVDGIGIGVKQADDNTYYSGAASLGVGGNFASGSTIDAATAFDGWMDETRFTVNAARYNADFTPPSAIFGRTVGADADFAKVMLLLGYDADPIIDESDVARVLTIHANAVTGDVPDDGDFSYQVLNQRPAWDDTYIEAAHKFATSVLTMTAIPLATETITIGTQTYTWIAAVASADDVLIGASISDSFDNLIAAINGGAGEGTAYGTGTVANTSATGQLYADDAIQLVAVTIGASTVVTTETMTAGSFTAATMNNGEDIPSDSDFTIERLPIDVSGILAVQGTARVSKTDAGSASMRLDFIGPSAGVAVGTALSVDLNPSWQRQIFEEDPDTVASLTPSSIIGGRLRFKRTA